MKDNQKTNEKPKLLYGVIGAFLGGTIVFVLSTLVQPSLEQVGKKARDKLFPKTGPKVFMNACAPLVSASRLFRAFNPSDNTDIAIHKEESDANNRVSVEVFNLTEKTANDVTITIIPFFIHEPIEFAYTSITTNSLAGSKKYKVKRGSLGEIMISIDSLPNGEGILIDQVIYGVVDLHVEFRSKEYSVRKFFPRGCPEMVAYANVKRVYSIYEKTTNICGEPIKGSKGGFGCKSEITPPMSFLKQLPKEAGIEITQYRNGEVEYTTGLFLKIQPDTDSKP